VVYDRCFIFVYRELLQRSEFDVNEVPVPVTCGLFIQVGGVNCWWTI